MKKSLAAMFALVVAFAMTTSAIAQETQETQPSLSDKPVVQQPTETPAAVTPAPVVSQPMPMTITSGVIAPAPVVSSCGCGTMTVAPIVYQDAVTPTPVQSPANVVVEGVQAQPAPVMTTTVPTQGCGCGTAQPAVVGTVATPVVASGCNTCDPCCNNRRVRVRRVRILGRRCCN